MNLICTYGICPKNPGMGSWGYVIVIDGETVCECLGAELKTTSNRIELMSIIRGISGYINISEDKYVTVQSNSVNVVNAFNKDWVRRWRQKGWITREKTPVAAVELWDQLLSFTKDLRVTWEKADKSAWNKRAEFLAWEGIKK